MVQEIGSAGLGLETLGPVECLLFKGGQACGGMSCRAKASWPGQHSEIGVGSCTKKIISVTCTLNPTPQNMTLKLHNG